MNRRDSLGAVGVVLLVIVAFLNPLLGLATVAAILILAALLA